MALIGFGQAVVKIGSVRKVQAKEPAKIRFKKRREPHQPLLGGVPDPQSQFEPIFLAPALLQPQMPVPHFRDRHKPSFTASCGAMNRGSVSTS
ncbi:hypothetical protein B5K06_33655 [Rhizobium grahamii]|uniref:Uncharacterized protein n=1 Tax=Rhizobium grahamii TaxID=1120045 RepID=A0A370KF93_9HYPH|nr:hypothetical protein B5K06_33655 [Rhizobium grahamii]